MCRNVRQQQQKWKQSEYIEPTRASHERFNLTIKVGDRRQYTHATMVCGGHENGTSVWSTHAGNATISGGGTSAFVTMEMDLFKVVAVFGAATITMVLVRLYAGAFANRLGEAGWLAGCPQISTCSQS